MARSKEFEFYLKADLSKYSGKYVAIVEDKVVAWGENAKEVFEEAKKKSGKLPTIAKIPKEEALIFLGRADVFNLFDICFKKNKKTVFMD